jgi:hypothetical protein
MPQQLTQWGWSLVILATVVACSESWCDEGRQRIAMTELRETAVAAEKYFDAHGAYPATGPESPISHTALIAALVPKYLSRLPENDPWGQPYGWAASAEHYSLVSFGSDRLPDVTRVVGPHWRRPEKDLVLSDGQWSIYAEGGGCCWCCSECD